MQTLSSRIRSLRLKHIFHPNVLVVCSLLLSISMPAVAFAQIEHQAATTSDTCQVLVPGCGYLEPGTAQPYTAQSFATHATKAPLATHTVVYSVEFRGTITVDKAQFQQEALQTLNDPRGWSQLGTQFAQVGQGGSFTLVLIQAALLDGIPGCDSQWSCRSGSQVLINQDRWASTSTAWQASGGSLRDYHHMVINHEVGHWLGHEHEYCGGAGQPAPVMQQQSIDLQGCAFNPWPLASELWTSRF